MKESFEEIVNILENRYKSYSPHHYDMFNYLINTNDLIKNIDESLKKYYNLKKSYLKTKVDYL